jgi:hypothetical protein
MLPDIQGIKKVSNNNSLYTLWTKYGKWDSEGTLLFEERSVLRQIGDSRASNDVDVPASCFVFRLSEQTRRELNLVVSDILIRDDYRQVLDDIYNIATNKALLPLHDFSSGAFRNPFLNTEQSMIGAVTLLGHPGIGKQSMQYNVCDFSSCPPGPSQAKAFGYISSLYSVFLRDVQLSTTQASYAMISESVTSLTQMAYTK